MGVIVRRSIKLGLNATEKAVKQSKLDDYRIVYFATHGLVAGDLQEFTKAKAEPALAFTIPEKPSDLDDGLLQASEVAELKLDADWVVLSACNTASSDGVGAEPLSGLARAFIYAGGKSLVVSNWDVLLAAMMAETFPADQIAVVTGDAKVGSAFASLPFDRLLFTGSIPVGRSIMRAASENLVPVTLELGGKSPVIIEHGYSLRKAARRITFGKLANCGQTCVAPDYALIPEHGVEEFVVAFTAEAEGSIRISRTTPTTRGS